MEYCIMNWLMYGWIMDEVIGIWMDKWVGGQE